MKTKYRIVEDNVCGYQAQFKEWWFLTWGNFGYSKRTLDDAKEKVEECKDILRKQGKKSVVWQSDQIEVKETKGKVIEVEWFGVFVIICAVIGAICIIAMLISPWFPNFISK